MITGDFHTHTKASDGRSTVADNVGAALSAGLKYLAVTDHSFLSIKYRLTREKFEKQRAQIEYLTAGGQIVVLQGVEANLLADGTIDVPEDMIEKCGVLHLGFHRLLQPRIWKKYFSFIFGNGWLSQRQKQKFVQTNTEAYIKAMQTYPVDALCHLNHRCPVNIKAVCECAKQHGVYVELNEKHIDALYEYARVLTESGVDFILGSDAHCKNKVGRFPRTEAFIKEYSIPTDRIYGLNGKTPVFKDKTNWKIK